MNRLTVICALCLCLWSCQDADDSTVYIIERVPVAQGTLDISITEDGSLDSANSVDIKTEIGGDILWVIEDGSEVKKGDKLIELDSQERKEGLESKVFELEKSERELEEFREELKIFGMEAERRRQEAIDKRAFAEMALSQYKEGKSPFTKKEHELKVESARIALDDHQDKVTRMPALLEKGFITQSELRQAELRARELAQDLERSERNLDVWKTFDHPQELARKTSDLESATLNIQREEMRIKSELNRKQATLKSKEFQIQRQRTKIEKKQKEIGQMIITAPADGIVVHDSGNSWNKKGPLKIGDNVHSNEMIMSLPDLSNMVVQTKVNEVNVGKLQEGQSTTSVIEAMNNASYIGEVRKIATTASDTWGSSVKEYMTEVTLEETEGAHFRPDLSVKVTILLESIPDVLFIPLGAVYQTDGQAYCYVEDDDGRPKRRDVTIGSANDDMVIVQDGLTEGEEVLLLAAEPEKTDIGND